MNSYIGKIGLMLVAIIWGTGFVASALALENYSAYQILAIRFTIAFLVLLVLNIKRLKVLSAKTIK
jgi:drug/metabolite transporter (DMT)-like permease